VERSGPGTSWHIQFYSVLPLKHFDISNLGVDQRICKAITLDLKDLDPESLTGLLHGITDVGAMNLPGIFRYWKEEKASAMRFAEFKNYFAKGIEDGCVFKTKNSKGDISEDNTAQGHL